MTVLITHSGEFARGFLTTVLLVVLGWSGAMILGTAVTAMRLSAVRSARAAAFVYVGVFRNIPIPVQMVLFVFGLPLVGVEYSLFTSAVCVLVIYTAAFVAETIRSGLNTVARGEMEAARALGLSPATSMRLIVLPQAFASVVQPLGNVLITMVKNTSVAAVVGVGELTFVADKVAVAEAQTFVVFGGAVVGYLLIGLSIGRLVDRLDEKVRFSR
jgi:glutamate transport system permease protein